MRFRSSGLGETELKGNMSAFATAGADLLVLQIDTYEPVQWHLRAAVERRDIPVIVKGLVKPAILFHMIRAFFYVKKNPTEVEDLMDKSI